MLFDGMPGIVYVVTKRCFSGSLSYKVFVNKKDAAAYYAEQMMVDSQVCYSPVECEIIYNNIID